MFERADSLEKEQTGDSPYQPPFNFISRPNTFYAFLRAVCPERNRADVRADSGLREA